MNTSFSIRAQRSVSFPDAADGELLASFGEALSIIRELQCRDNSCDPPIDLSELYAVQAKATAKMADALVDREREALMRENTKFAYTRQLLMEAARAHGYSTPELWVASFSEPGWHLTPGDCLRFVASLPQVA